MLCGVGKSIPGFGLVADSLVVYMYPLGVDVDNSVSVVAVAHVEGARHYAGHTCITVSACIIYAPAVVVAVDVSDDGILLKKSDIVGIVV